MKKKTTKLPSALQLARDAVKDTDSDSKQRQWRAFMREGHLATALIAKDKEVRQLRNALAAACDVATDAADLLLSEGVMTPEEDDEIAFRTTVAKLRKLAKRPAAPQHISHAKLPPTLVEILTPHVKEDLGPREEDGIGIGSDGEYTTNGVKW